MALLDIVSNVSKELKFGSVMTVVGNTDGNVQQLYSLVRREGLHLVKRYSFQELREEATHTTLAQEDQGDINTIAPGFDRTVPNSGWNRTLRRRLVGPVSPEEWQDMKGWDYQPTWPHFMVRGDKLLIHEPPAAGQTLAFEYYSNYWIKSSGGTKKAEFTADSDVPRIDSDIIELGAIWRFQEANGLDYAEKKRDYEVALAGYKFNNTPRRIRLGERRRGPTGADFRVIT